LRILDLLLAAEDTKETEGTKEIAGVEAEAL
jgi:hypothetical protein